MFFGFYYLTSSWGLIICSHNMLCASLSLNHQPLAMTILPSSAASSPFSQARSIVYWEKEHSHFHSFHQIQSLSFRETCYINREQTFVFGRNRHGKFNQMKIPLHYLLGRGAIGKLFLWLFLWSAPWHFVSGLSSLLPSICFLWSHLSSQSWGLMSLALRSGILYD